MYGAEVTDEKKDGSFLLLLLDCVDPQERISRSEDGRRFSIISFKCISSDLCEVDLTPKAVLE